MPVRARLRPSETAMALSPLFAPVTWRLQPGAAGAPGVRFLGTMLLVALALLYGAWLLALGFDVKQGRRSVWVLLVAGPLTWLWWRLFRQGWSRWHAVQPLLLLSWSGEVQDEPAAGGWRLGGLAGTPAEVRCLFDAQGGLLCLIRSMGEGASSPAVHWCWIQVQTCPDVHRLRTLMALPPRLTTVLEGASDLHAPAVASWTLRRQPPGIALRGPSDTFMPTQPWGACDEASAPTRKDRP